MDGPTNAHSFFYVVASANTPKIDSSDMGFFRSYYQSKYIGVLINTFFGYMRVGYVPIISPVTMATNDSSMIAKKHVCLQHVKMHINCMF